jgi:hypothetical protein
MPRQEIIRTTLGELIVALTDEARKLVVEPSEAYRIVSYVLSDMALRRHVRLRKRGRHYELRFVNASTDKKIKRRLAG